MRPLTAMLADLCGPLHGEERRICLVNPAESSLESYCQLLPPAPSMPCRSCPRPTLRGVPKPLRSWWLPGTGSLLCLPPASPQPRKSLQPTARDSRRREASWILTATTDAAPLGEHGSAISCSRFVPFCPPEATTSLGAVISFLPVRPLQEGKVFASWQSRRVGEEQR
jgi:hypothetical protein